MVGSKIHSSLLVTLGVVGMAVVLLCWLPMKERLSAAGGQPIALPEVDSSPLTGPDSDPLPAGALVRLGRERLRQRGGIAVLAFSPDGKILASIEPPGLDFPAKHVTPLAMSDRYLTAGPANYKQDIPGKHVIHLWNVATGKEIRRLEGPTQHFISNFLFSSDGKRLFLLGNRMFSVLEVVTGKEVHQLKGPWDPNQDPRMVVSSDGKFLAWMVQMKSPIHVCDTSTGHEVCQLAIQNYEQPVGFKDGAKRLITVSIPDRIVRLRDITTGAVAQQFVLPIKGMGGFRITFSADSKELLAWQNNGPIHCWDLNAAREVREIDTSVSRDTPEAALSPDGRTVATGSFDGKIRLYDTATGGHIREIPAHAGRLRVLTFSADGKVLASKDAWDGAIQLWDMATGKKISPSEGHQAGISSLSIAPDGKTVATVGQDNTIRFWERATGQELRRFPTFGRAIAFSPDGKTLATGTDPVLLLDAAMGKKVRTFAGADRSFIRTLAFSPDGTMLAGGGTGRVNCSWYTATGQVLLSLPGHEIWSSAFSADGTTLAIGFGETIELWGLKGAGGLVELRRFGRPPQPVGYAHGFSSLAFSPDGKLLAAADGVNGSQLRMPPPRDGVIRLYEVATGQELLVLKGHRRLVTSVQFSPDGKTLVSGGEDGTVRLWEATSGKELHRFEGHRDTVTCVAFAPDGRTVISGSRDSTALVWDITLPRP